MAFRYSVAVKAWIEFTPGRILQLCVRDREQAKKSGAYISAHPFVFPERKSELRTSCNESLTSFVTCVLLEVLDESGSQILCLDFPILRILVCISWIKNSCINAVELCWNLKVEEWDLLCRSCEDVAIEDSIDDTSCILDGDSLSCSVPSCVDKVSLCTRLLHLLYKLFTILCRRQLEECLAEAC